MIIKTEPDSGAKATEARRSDPGGVIDFASDTDDELEEEVDMLDQTAKTKGARERKTLRGKAHSDSHRGYRPKSTDQQLCSWLRVQDRRRLCRLRQSKPSAILNPPKRQVLGRKSNRGPLRLQWQQVSQRWWCAASPSIAVAERG